MPLDGYAEQQLTGGGDTLLHYHLQDRGPFPIPHGSFYDTTAHAIASTSTAYPLTYNTTVLSDNVSIVSSSKITVATSGVYNIQFSCQLENSDTGSVHDAEIWFALNGTNITESSTIVGIPASHGGTHGHTVAAWNLFVRMNRSDYVQLFWRADSTSVSMPYRAATTSPTRPSVPSIILTANLVSV